MKTCATIVLIAALFTSPAGAAVIWDEGMNGDLGTDPLIPTPLALSLGGNTVIGTVSNVAGTDRDYITFTIPPFHVLSSLNLLVFTPNNLGFAAFNSGSTGFVPSAATNALFLSGIHPSAADVGMDLMPFFVNRAVTTNALPSPELGPGTYCFIIQQTSAITQSYSLEFVMQGSVPTETKTWSSIKALYQ